MRRLKAKDWRNLLVLVVVSMGVFYTTGLTQKAWDWLAGARYKKAAIVVDVRQEREFKRVWQGVAQGFEEEGMRLDEVGRRLKGTEIKYVRLDHVLDGYGLIQRGEDGRLRYDFTRLDRVVNDILAMGAKPFFSLSYMPAAIADGDVTEPPRDWSEYARVVSWFVSHYSRDFRGGIEGVAYEVWNEPDLFGQWRTYGPKNYLTLYSVAVKAAQGVRGAKPFLIGGSATTGFYPAWAEDFYKKLAVRRDFFSWHRYSYEVDDFVADARQAEQVIAPLTQAKQQVFITEWGPSPERGKVYDSRLAAAHLVAVVRALEDSVVDLAFAFELQDGPGGGQWHGGWGMWTNPAYGEPVAKPRWQAYRFLDRLKGVRLGVIGEGSFVKALAARDDGGQVRVVIVNYDKRGKHSEVFPVRVSGLEEGRYRVREEYLGGRKLEVEVEAVGGKLEREYSLAANEVVMVEVEPVK